MTTVVTPNEVTHDVTREVARHPRVAAPRPRAPRFDFGEPIPHAWLGGSALGTHLINSVNLLFPDGERFFIRAVHHFLKEVDDPVLRARVRGFASQEGRHAYEHERFFQVLEDQGYSVQRVLDLTQKLGYDLLEPRVSPELRLSVTVALEHYTALLANEALSGDILDFAHPTLRALLSWHAAEEIEHKSVAFDVLEAVRPSYALRMRGMAMATAILVTFWASAYVMLVADDVKSGRPILPKKKERKELRRHAALGKIFWKGLRDYMRRDFHPWDLDDASLSEKYVEGLD